MKILVFGRASSDYLQDDIYHGLKSLLGTDVESNVNLSYLYQDFTGSLLSIYGRGISYAKNIDPALRHVVSPQEISQRLDASYYDMVIYLSMHRCDQQLAEVLQKVPREKIFFCDGEDSMVIKNPLGIKLFKRELAQEPTDSLFPISFAIPEEKIVIGSVVKTHFMSTETPVDGRRYQFTKEEDYYREYQSSWFALTHKRGGWDCKRHYEILCNKCVPVFIDIDNCPPHIMKTLPKRLFSEIAKSYKEVSPETYASWSEDLYAYTKERLTTKKLAQYIVEHLPDIPRKEITAKHRSYTDVLNKAKVVGLHHGFGVGCCGGYLLQQNPRELASLVSFLRLLPKGLGTFVEIGTASGGTLRFLCEELTSERILSIDNGEHAHVGHQKNNLAGVKNLTRFVGDSHGQEAKNALHSWTQGEPVIDVAFIDGDHSKEGVLKDFYLVQPYLKPSSLVILHDTTAVAAVAEARNQLIKDSKVHILAEFIAPREETPAFGITVCGVLP